MIILVLLLAFILRFFNLVGVPPALDWDESSTAYNAYSILKTGRDEFGVTYPFLFRAFDGYVPPVLIYLNVSSVALFGLNELGARAPNALLGTLTVFGLWLLLKQAGATKNLAGLAALFMAISPWHVTYSRVNFFSTLPIFFIVFGTYFFLLSFSKKYALFVSVIFFILAIFSYFSAYVFVPIFVSCLAYFFRRKLKTGRMLLFVAPILASAIFILFFAPGGQARLRGVSAFADPDLIKESALLARDDGLIGKILYNRRLVYGQKFLEGYFANYSFDFLFAKKDTVLRMAVPGLGFGLLYILDLPFLILGGYLLVRRKPQFWKLVLAWLVIAPIASAATLPQMTSTRVSIMVVPLIIVSAYGFGNVIRAKPFLRNLLIVLLALSFFLFGYSYFAHFSKMKSAEWFWGYRELFGFVNNIDARVYFFYKQHEPLDQVHIFNLFYNRVDPAAWQANGGTKLGCGATTGQFFFAKYHFIPYECLTNGSGLGDFGPEDLIVTAKDLKASPIKIVYYPDGKEAFFVYRYRDVSVQVKELL